MEEKMPSLYSKFLP